MKILNSKFIGHAYQKIQIGAGWVNMALQFMGFMTFVKVWQGTIEFYNLPFVPILIITPFIVIGSEYLIGHYQITTKVQSEMNSLLNLQSNPEVLAILQKVDTILRNQEKEQ
jgi:hypothetical protein